MDTSKNLPTAAVTAMASNPQKITRHKLGNTAEPPARTATTPSNARLSSDVPATQTLKPCIGASAATPSGSAAPTAKLAADAMAACKGLALKALVIPSSSRAWAPSASCLESWDATCAASSGDNPRAR